MIQLMHGDCLELMEKIPDGSVDLICTDLPYATTQNQWDSLIDLSRLWTAYRRVLIQGGGCGTNGGSTVYFDSGNKQSQRLQPHMGVAQITGNRSSQCKEAANEGH